VNLLPLLGRPDLSEGQRQLLDELTAQRRGVLAELSRLAASVSTQQVLPLERIQQRLPADSALVFWLEPLGGSLGCVVRREGGPVWVLLSGTGKGGAWTEADRVLPFRLYRTLSDPTSSVAERGRLVKAVVEQRLRPLHSALGARGKLPAVRRLFVVPIGPMAFVPLEALGTGYLISYVPSGSVLARALEGHRPLSGSSLLALGNPVFTPSESKPPPPPRYGLLLTAVLPGGNAARAGLQSGDVLLACGKHKIENVADLKRALAEAPGEARYWREGKEARTGALRAGSLGVRASPLPVAQAVARWREQGCTVVRRGTGHKSLPGTAREVEALAALVKGSTKLLGSDASEQELDRLHRVGELRRYRLLHFATHGEVDEAEPDRCRLILAQDKLPDPLRLPPGEKAVSGELTVQTIRQEWKLDADLVVLSACQTALGKEARGDGLLGFAQAFLSRGARSVVLSRWQVDDEATALLMVRFYQNLLGKREGLKKPLPRAEALEEAKEWLRNLSAKEVKGAVERLPRGKGAKPVPLRKEARPFAHPYYWAAFVLVGDPS
jgi:hypothetical protein